MVHSRTSASPGSPRPGAGDQSPDERSPKRRKTESSSNNSGRTTSTRRKTACQSCRLRKVKCDNLRPRCGICIATDNTCEYTDPLPEKLTIESATELLSNKLDELRDDIRKLHERQDDRVNDENRTNFEHGDPDRPQEQRALYTAEPSKDFLQIPAHRTTADTVLSWDVFEGRYPPMALVGILFNPHENDFSPNKGNEIDFLTVPGGLIPPNEEQIPLLVDNFLRNVHTKNPVLDVEQLVRQARIIASNGLGWDAWSCLVLLASALGSIAKPFDAAVNVAPSPSLEGGTTASWIHDAPSTHKELQQAESCFVLACRRIGCLKASILGAQCHFIAGIYLMYTLRPLLSWQYFTHASVLYQLYMKRTHRLSVDVSQVGQLPIQHGDMMDVKKQRLEESMYWSCFKSEIEFRVELPLPQSEISNYYHSAMFPNPPDSRTEATSNLEPSLISNSNVAFGERPDLTKTTSHLAEISNLREHAKQLCNEEESWYYYLTEIALRRIGNRIINTFFSQDPPTWMDVRPLLSMALEFDNQVSAWSAHLPAAMQHWETNYTIRAPMLESGSTNPVSRELSWATENRLLEMRSWLYQPFLYYLIHNKTETGIFSSSITPSREDFIKLVLQGPGEFDEEDAAALYHFIVAGIECNVKILDVRSLRHRHHGLWYDMRSLMTASIILLAIVKSGHDDWIRGGAEMLWGHSPQSHPHDHPIRGKIGHVMEEFSFWFDESPDLQRHRDMLEDVTRFVQAAWFEKKHL